MLVLRDAFGTLWRYDGATALIERITPLGAWTMLRQTPDGVYEVGTHGGGVFVPWSGPARTVECDGWIMAVSSTRTCAAFRGVAPSERSFIVQREGGVAAVLFPADWGAGGAAWDPSSRRLAVTRRVETRCMRCPNALYVVGADGRPKLLFDTAEEDGVHTIEMGAVARFSWAPGGDLIAVTFGHGAAGYDARVGHALMLIDAASAATTSLGITPGNTSDVAWSARGDLAFVRGTLDTISTSTLELRTADGRVSELDASGRAPAWDSTGERLAWVRHDGSGVVLDLATRSTSTIRCPVGGVSAMRFARDRDGKLVLCRLPGLDVDRYEIRFMAGARDEVVLHELGGALAYGIGPDFLDFVAWSEGAAREF